MPVFFVVSETRNRSLIFSNIHSVRSFQNLKFERHWQSRPKWKFGLVKNLAFNFWSRKPDWQSLDMGVVSALHRQGFSYTGLCNAISTGHKSEIEQRIKKLSETPHKLFNALMHLKYTFRAIYWIEYILLGLYPYSFVSNDNCRNIKDNNISYNTLLKQYEVTIFVYLYDKFLYTTVL